MRSVDEPDAVESSEPVKSLAPTENSEEGTKSCSATGPLHNTVTKRQRPLDGDDFVDYGPLEDLLRAEHPEDTQLWKDLLRICKNVRLLNLFSGPARPQDGISAVGASLGATVDDVDIEISPSHDLTKASVWDPIQHRLDHGDYDGTGNAMPCGTFCPGRNWWDDGPPPVRGEYDPEIFGLPTNTPQQQKDVKIGTLLALRGLYSLKIVRI